VFALYGLIDASASFDRQSHVQKSEVEVPFVLQSEIVRGVCHAFYGFVALFWLIMTVVRFDGVSTRRLVFIGISVVATVGTAFLTDVVLVLAQIWVYTMKLVLLQRSTTLTLAAVALFLFHSNSGEEYMGLAKGVPDSEMDLDRLSDEPLDPGNWDEEEDYEAG
jgi:hypothetical protein